MNNDGGSTGGQGEPGNGMRVAHAIHLFYPEKGGIEIHAYNLLRSMPCARKRVYTTFGSRERDAPGGAGLAERERVDGIDVRRFGSFGFPGFSSVRFSPGMMLALLRDDSDLFCSHGYGSLMPLMASLVALAKRKPFVFTLHGYPKLGGMGGVFLKAYRLFIAPVFLGIARKVIVVSKSGIPEIESQVDPKKIVYIPNGVNAEKFAAVNPAFWESMELAYFGRFEKYKGIETLLEAFSLLRGRHPGLRLALYGKDEDYAKSLEKLASKMGIGISIGQVEHEKIAEAYGRTRAVLMASLYEGFSLVWLEALASGRAMFTTPVGDARIFLEDVFGSEADNFIFSEANELADKLGYFLENGEKFKPIVARARKAVLERYGWKNVAAKTMAVYQECLQRK